MRSMIADGKTLQNYYISVHMSSLNTLIRAILLKNFGVLKTIITPIRSNGKLSFWVMLQGTNVIGIGILHPLAVASISPKENSYIIFRNEYSGRITIFRHFITAPSYTSGQPYILKCKSSKLLFNKEYLYLGAR